jgi:hypothetical protein
MCLRLVCTGFFAICVRSCGEWQKLRLLGHRPVQAEKYVIDIRFHVDAYLLAGEIPLDI